MKILAVDHNAIDPTHRSLYTHLASAPGVEMKLIVPRRWHDGYRFLSFEDSRNEEHPGITALDVILPTRTHRMLYVGLRKQINAFRPDLVFVNAEPENFQTWHAAMIAKERPGLRFVCSSWRNIDHPRTGYPYRFGRLHQMAERAVLHRADHLVCYTHEGEEIFRRNGFDRCSCISPAIDVPSFSGQEVSHRTVQDSPFIIGFAGRCIPEKGVDLLIRSAARLRFEYRLVIIGDGPERPNWQRLASELGVANRLQWTGGVPREAMPGLIGHLDLLVLPSRTGSMWKEQFGRVLAEAMASGVPVIGSDSGEIPRVIGDAGRVFREDNIDELAGLINSIHENTELRTELIAKGKRRSLDHFSIDVQVPKFLKLFRTLVDGRKPPGIS